MGYVFATAACISCRRIFGFNPHKVPSIRIDGVRQPVCRQCIEAANPKRINAGLPPVEILPGAYDPMDEVEL
jgi:hypothetical protein